MSIENYLIIEENVVTNVILWDGDRSTWIPPDNSLVMPQKTMPTRIWALVNDDAVLVDSIGDALIGFTYDGERCITNLPKPEDVGRPPNT